MNISKRMGAEFIGTFWLVLGGCGSAVLAANFGGSGVGLLGVALAFGLDVALMEFFSIKVIKNKMKTLMSLCFIKATF